MARLVFGTPEYERAFGNVPEVPLFTSNMPEYYALSQAWADPSIRADLGLDNRDALNSKLSKDLQLGSQRMTWAMAVPGSAANIQSVLLAGVRELTFSSSISSILPQKEMLKILDPLNRPAGGRGLIGVAVGAALAAAGVAIPIVGQIAGFLVALGSAIFGAVNRNKKKKDLAEAKYREELYKTFPPLQVADSATDTQIARKIHSLMETEDWTPIFSPRFKGEWVGIERDKGFAFAPGDNTDFSEEFGQDIQSFVPTGGIGCIPNSGIITSVIQVNLDPRGSEMAGFLKNGMYDPRQQPGAASRVVDTGVFYGAAANQASLAWSWLSEDRGNQGNPLVFRLHVQAMADAWQEYFLSGLDYIRKVALPWWESDRDENSNLEGFFASAVFYACGAWTKQISGGTTLHPIYSQFSEPYGVFRDDMVQERLYRFSENGGAFLPIRGSQLGLTENMGSQWERGPNVKATCVALADQQRYDLEHTFVSMYVRRSAAAFKNKALADVLDARRRAVLKREDRDKIVFDDIPEGETLDGKSLREAATAAGVPKIPKKGPTDKLSAPPRPQPPGFQGGMGGGLLGAPPRSHLARNVAIFGSVLAAAAYGGKRIAAWRSNA